MSAKEQNKIVTKIYIALKIIFALLFIAGVVFVNSYVYKAYDDVGLYASTHIASVLMLVVGFMLTKKVTEKRGATFGLE